MCREIFEAFHEGWFEVRRAQPRSTNARLTNSLPCFLHRWKKCLLCWHKLQSMQSEKFFCFQLCSIYYDGSQIISVLNSVDWLTLYAVCYCLWLFLASSWNQIAYKISDASVPRLQKILYKFKRAISMLTHKSWFGPHLNYKPLVWNLWEPLTHFPPKYSLFVHNISLCPTIIYLQVPCFINK